VSANAASFFNNRDMESGGVCVHRGVPEVEHLKYSPRRPCPTYTICARQFKFGKDELHHMVGEVFRASSAGRLIRPPRVRTCPRGQKYGEKPPQQPNPPTHSRLKCGDNWVSTDRCMRPRAYHRVLPRPTWQRPQQPVIFKIRVSPLFHASLRPPSSIHAICAYQSARSSMLTPRRPCRMASLQASSINKPTVAPLPSTLPVTHRP
jgi:hypothetical protein